MVKRSLVVVWKIGTEMIMLDFTSIAKKILAIFRKRIGGNFSFSMLTWKRV